ncbi:MAG TPA: hypothetical protein VHL08_05700 [Dongiaceae bacterium]|jgi:hypothetical protein|nr:hypothetical protein [Dongiaceae bacterium]
MKETTLFLLGAAFAVIGMGGLFWAAMARFGMLYWLGLGLFIFCVILEFGLIGALAALKPGGRR